MGAYEELRLQQAINEATGLDRKSGHGSMMDAFDEQGWVRATKAWTRWSADLRNAAKAAGPPLLFGLRLWASVCLALYIVFWLELDNDQGYDQPDLVLQPLRAKTSEINAARRCN